jgi:tRNA 2-thiouridine synthesizing protein A
MSDFDKELDTSGLNCPLPIIKAKKEINAMEIGEVLHIISTDPGAVKDFESFANQTGNELLKTEEKDNKFYFLMKKTK